jgi:hypothetical protein
MAESFYTATTRFGRLDFVFHTVGATVSECEVVQVTALRCSSRCGRIVRARRVRRAPFSTLKCQAGASENARGAATVRTFVVDEATDAMRLPRATSSHETSLASAISDIAFATPASLASRSYAVSDVTT